MAQKRCEGSSYLSVHHVTGIQFLSVACVKFTPILFLQCLAGVREAFAAVEAALMGGNGSQLAVDFGCCQIPEDLDDQVMAFGFYEMI